MRKALFLLGMLSDSDIDWLIAAGNRERVSRGTVLIHEGKPFDAIYFVLDGTLGVSVAALGGREIAQLKCGEIVGEMSFVDSRPPSATVKALEDSVVLSVSRARMEAKLEQVEFAARFYRALSVFLADRLRNTIYQFGEAKVALSERDFEGSDQLDPSVLEKVAMAGARFDWLMRRLRGE
jgi:CRP/FNR family cyclic AMP-dependent transcriptional regulator